MPMTNNFNKLLEEKQRKEGRYIPIAEIANETRITRKTLYQWQRGEMQNFNVKVIDALCEYFGVEMNELLVHTSPAKTKSARK
jgi:DNA-binding Xre family transcriptional regulator